MAQFTAPKVSDYEIVHTGEAADIRLSPGACTDYRQAIEGNDKLSVQRRTHLGRYFTEFCGHDAFHKRLNQQQFRREGSFKDGAGREVPIWTFKAPKWRLYGAILHLDGRRCFVGTRVDADKKQDSADQAILRATAKDIGSLVELGQKRKNVKGKQNG